MGNDDSYSVPGGKTHPNHVIYQVFARNLVSRSPLLVRKFLGF